MDYFAKQKELHNEVDKSSTDDVVGIVSDRKIDPIIGPVVRVTYPDCDGKVSPWLQVQQKSTIGRASNHLPRLRERVTVKKFPNGRETGVVTGSLYCTSVSAPTQTSINNDSQTYDDGSIVEMNPDTGNAIATITQSIQVDAGATINVSANSVITISAGGQITVNSSAEVLVTAPTINCNGVTIDSSGNVSIPGKLDVTSTVTFKADGSIATHLTNGDGAGGGA